MARKENTANAPERAPVEILGIVLIALSLLLLFALFSYDKYDVHYTQEPAHSPKHNFIGSVGAYGAYYIFFVFGAGAYLIPILLIVFGFAHFSGALAYLRRRSMVAWAAVLVLCCMALLSQYTDDRAVEAIQKHLPNNAGFLEKMSANINSPSAGGIIGLTLRDRLLVHIGRVGAPILLITVYLIALVFLSDFHLIDMIRNLRKAEVKGPDSTEAEEELERKARDLEKQAKKLKDEVEKTARTKAKEEAKPEPEPEPEPVQPPKDTRVMGADMQPVPEPTVRDLSVPQPRPPGPEPVEPPKPSRRSKKSLEPGSENIVQEGDIIPAEEVKAAATPEQILGRPSKAKKSESPTEPARDEKLPASQETAPVEAGAMAPTAAPEPVLVNADTETKSGIDEKTSTETPAEVIPVAAVAVPAEPLPPVPVPRPRPQPKKPKPITVASTPMIGNYRLPLLDFLQMPDLSIKPTETKEELMANAQLMKNTLAQFDIDVSLGDITKGPTITRYELHPAPGVKLEKITALNNNIAAALKAERINILAPVPGKSSVGVEVPNLVKTKVIMRDLLESPEWQTSKARIPLALGKDVYGHPIVADLAEMPHCLIAGSTGSGKSVCINSIIASLLYRFSPDQLRFVMIDPKVVELQQYNALPHLVVPVVTDPKKVILALRWVVNEMEKRYQIFARVGVRNIKSFNDRPKEKDAEKLRAQRELELPLTAKKEKIEPGSDGFAVQLDEEIVVPRDEDIIIPEKLSYIVVIIDELADLMLVAPADVEMAIARITQMARAAGIHCIVATQRPSVDVITGVIKANIPARIAFQVAAKVDSRTILDAMGADKLLGKGDMLYLPPGSARLIRAQGVLITDQEIQSVVDFIAQQGKPSYEMEIHQQLQKPTPSFGAEESGCGEDEAIIEQCIEVIRSEQKASVSLLQRRLKLGYGRAARIMDELENRGIVGPSKGAEPRDILIDLDGGGADGAGQ